MSDVASKAVSAAADKLNGTSFGTVIAVIYLVLPVNVVAEPAAKAEALSALVTHPLTAPL